MRSEDLVALCGARGLNLQAIAESGTNAAPVSDVRRYQRHGVQVVQLKPTAQQRAYGKETRTVIEREWTVQELGQAAAGVPRLAFLAACFSWAGERGHFLELHDGLMAYALRSRRLFKWPFQVSGVDGQGVHYLEKLCMLVLIQDSPESFFGGADLRLVKACLGVRSEAFFALHCGVTEAVWSKSLADRFDRLQLVWWGWHNQAARMMQSRLRDDEGADDVGA